MTMIHCLIVEDEEHCINTLKQFIQKHYAWVPCSIIATADSCEAAIHAINTLKPDLIFLDVELKDGSSLTIFPRLQYRAFKIIFTTAFDQFALQAIRLSALDYLLKPVDEDEFMQVLGKVSASLPQADPEQLENATRVYQSKNQAQKHQIAIRKNEDIYFLKNSRYSCL